MERKGYNKNLKNKILLSFFTFLFLIINSNKINALSFNGDILNLMKLENPVGHNAYARDKGLIPKENYLPDTGGYNKLDYSSNPLCFTEKANKTNAIELENFYPNPTFNSTSFFYKLPFEGFVNVTLYNSIGQAVREFVNEYKIPGMYKVEFDCKNLPSGVYFNMFKAGGVLTKTKLIILK